MITGSDFLGRHAKSQDGGRETHSGGLDGCGLGGGAPQLGVAFVCAVHL